jgi:methionyl-tRNA formyltransferase
MIPKIVFFGTPTFGVMILERLITKGFIPIAVVTREDKPAGRGQKPTPPPVKITACKYKIPVLQPKKLRENQEIFSHLKSLSPDLFMVAAYGRIIPKEILKIPKYGISNVHPSLLPKYRGASPIQSAILAGEKETGITIILLDEELDHGPILAQEKLPISDTDTTESLTQKLGWLGAELLIKVVPDWIDGKIKPRQQNHQKATFTKMLKKEDGYIDLSNPPSAQNFNRMVRAFYPWPGVYTNLKRRQSLSASQHKNQKSKIIKFLPGNLIQPEGKKPLTIEQFKNGYPELAKKLSFILKNF